MKDCKNDTLRFREFNLEALEKSWEWLNDPEIKRMTTTPDFDKESQRKWFESLNEKNDYFIRTLYVEDELVGVFGIKHITKESGEVWGYMGEKKYWGRTIAINVFSYMLEYARSLNLESVYAVVLKTNYPSLRILKWFNFTTEKEVGNDRVVLRLVL